MAKGQYLSRHQQGIVKRYYEHKDSAAAQKLQEIVSDLYVTTDAKQASKLWKRAQTALAQAGVEAGRIERMVAERKVEALAALVNDLTKPR